MVRTRRTWKLALTVITIVLSLAIVIPLLGIVYESYARARDAARFPAPGRLIEIGNRKVHILCIGTGSPVVLFEASGFGTSVSSREARTKIAASTTVCSYDRMGMGWSDPGPSLISVGRLADDLRTLKDTVPIAAPFIVVASSIGGLTAELFARQHAVDVAGLVLLDAATSDAFARVSEIVEASDADRACSILWAAGETGVVRFVDPLGLRGSATANAETGALIYDKQPWNTLCAMVRAIPATRRDFENAAALPSSMPVIGLSAESTNNLVPPQLDELAHRIKPVLDQGLQTLAERSAAGRWRMVPGSDHLIAESAPAAVVAAVLEMIQRLGAEPRTPTASRVH